MKNFILLIFLIMVASKAFGCDSIYDEIKDMEAQVKLLKEDFNSCQKERMADELVRKAEEEQESSEENLEVEDE